MLPISFMSIAVSVVVRPSTILFVLTGAMYFGIVLMAAAIGLGWVGDLAFPIRLTIAGAGIIGACCGILSAVRSRRSFQVDITGTGQIRLTAYTVADARSACNRGDRVTGATARLLPQSTIWPGLLILRLQAEGGRIEIVRVFPDCLSADGLRALSVACRWIAAHNNRAERTIL